MSSRQTTGRSHDDRTALDGLRRARRAGFSTVNANLMSALPGETLEEWEANLDAVLADGVDQVRVSPSKAGALPWGELRPPREG